MKNEIQRLGHKFTKKLYQINGVKTERNIKPKAIKTLIKLRSIHGSVHYQSKFVTNLAISGHPLRPLLEKSEKFTWSGNHSTQF